MAKYLAQSAIIALCALILSAFLSGCGGDPPPLQPWFIEHFTVGQSTLPDGVSVEVIPNTTFRLPSEYLSVTNTSPTFLYLTTIEPPYSVPTGPQFEAPPVQLPAHGIPVFRVASGQTAVWDVTSTNPPWKFGWKPVEVEGYDSSDALRLYISRDNLAPASYEYYSYNIARFDSRNTFDYGGERPPNILIPAPHTIVLPMVYGTSEIDVPLTISYILNEAYETHKDVGPLLIFTGIVLFILLIWLGRRLSIRRSRPI